MQVLRLLDQQLLDQLLRQPFVGAAQLLAGGGWERLVALFPLKRPLQGEGQVVAVVLAIRLDFCEVVLD